MIVAFFLVCFYLCRALFVFFLFDRDHLDLHSFPTRRSSDLPSRRFQRARSPPRDAQIARTAGFPRLEGQAARSRSEEHTSELQSRQYLVCRLLLEKKNFQYKNSHIFLRLIIRLRGMTLT